MRHNIARNAADGGYTKKFVARNVSEVGRNSTAAILRAAILGVDTRCNLAIARNIAPCIRTLILIGVTFESSGWCFFTACCIIVTGSLTAGILFMRYFGLFSVASLDKQT